MTPRDGHPRGRAREPEIDDTAVEDLFAGRPVAPELAPVAGAVRALRAASDRPAPTPSAELARRMATGEFADAGGALQPPDRPAPGYRPAPAGRSRSRRLLPKLAAVAVAGTLIGAGTAGFAGSLPEPAQDRFETVVESVIPYEFPGKRAGDGDQPGESGDPDGPDDRDQPGGPADPRESGNPREFGDDVREDAKDGGVDGPDVSEDARDQQPGQRPDRPPGRPTDVPGPPRPPPGQDRGR